MHNEAYSVHRAKNEEILSGKLHFLSSGCPE